MNDDDVERRAPLTSVVVCPGHVNLSVFHFCCSIQNFTCGESIENHALNMESKSAPENVRISLIKIMVTRKGVIAAVTDPVSFKDQ